MIEISDAETARPAETRAKGDTPRSRNRVKVVAEDPGAELERRVARLEFASGALVRMRVPVRAPVEAGRDVLTDLDVLALDVDLRLRVTRSLVECKSGQGQAGEPDRLFWLAGLRQYAKTARATLVRQTVSGRGRMIARRLGIEVSDIAQIASRESAISWVPQRFGHVGGAECERAERRADEQLSALRFPSEVIGFLRADALLAPAAEILNVLSDLNIALAKLVLPNPSALVVGGHALIGLLIAALQDAQSLDNLAPAELQIRLERALTTGSPDQSNVLDVLGRADALVRAAIDDIHGAYEKSGIGRRETEVPSLRAIVAEPPTWIPRYIDFLHALRSNAEVARTLPQTAELAVFEALVGGDGHLYKSFSHLFTVEHRQLLRLAVMVLGEIAGPQSIQSFGEIGRIDFGRQAPAVPDRRGEPSRESKANEK